MKPLPNAKPAAPPRVIPTRPPTAEERRRAQRVLVRIRVNVQVDGKPANAVGHTTLILEKRDGKWVIVMNHTSEVPSAAPDSPASAAPPQAAPATPAAKPGL